ncbi:MAG: SAM-dependent MidA family methyltransferase [Gammaproteobacteria bacterium]
MSITELPLPDEHALTHSLALQEVIRDQIKDNEGHISFSRFMQMALYEPGLGYYSAGAIKFGESGDFTTAPEISPLFSICLARQCAEVMNELDQPMILELGAGTGVLASDLLKELQNLNSLPIKYYILEPGADLRQRQQDLLLARIPELMSKVCWLDALPEDGFEGLILANEVLDAMPVQRFRLGKKKIEELHVEWKEDGFAWGRYDANDELTQKIENIIQDSTTSFDDGYTSEINGNLPAWIKSMSDCLRRGVMLFVDYGYSRHEYYHEQRSQGTLICHYRHRAQSDPFLYVGLQDISASVDFTAVAEAAVSAKLSVSGFTTQAYFLMACGLEQIMHERKDMSQIQQLEFSRQIKLLTLPGEMGERFKVIALSRDIETELAGFSLIDHRRRL